MAYKLKLKNGQEYVGIYDKEVKKFMPYDSYPHNDYYKTENAKELTSCDECMKIFNPFFPRCPANYFQENNCPRQNLDEYKEKIRELKEEREKFVSEVIKKERVLMK